MNLIGRHFQKDHKYHKLLNRNTIKISYSCMNNMADRIKCQSNKILKHQQQQHCSTEQQQTCNCKQKPECPLNKIVYNQDWFIKQQFNQMAQLKNTLHSQKATLKPAIDTTPNLSTTKNTKWKLSYQNWYGR